MNALHPRVRLRWGLFAALAAVAAGLAVTVVDGYVLALSPWLGAVAAVALAPLLAWYVRAHYRHWRYELQEDALELERGVFTRVETAVPYVRVQHVDTRRDPLDRLLGLGRVVVYTAGSRGADVSVPGLDPERAREVRDRLRDLAIESEEDAV
ncbi:MAG: PH domain-containing protein [Haloarculaceae archaeon]